MSIEIEVVEVAEGDLAEHAKLFASYFPAGHQLRDPVYLRWLYFDNPAGRALGVVAREAGQWIGFMALIPAPLQRAAEELRAHFVVNVLVHPQHQGKYVFGKMIQVAREYVNSREGALMGHPNALAVTQWRRSRMHFHSELRPMLLRPAPGNFLPHSRVHELQPEWRLWQQLERERGSSSGWQLKVSAELLSWRFFAHPRKKYALYASGSTADPVALHATTRVKRVARLLLDSYVTAGSEQHALRALPWPTIALRPAGERIGSRAFIELPVSKRVPFFLTRDHAALRSDEVRSVGLTASDF